jgi:hypothetical protein
VDGIGGQAAAHQGVGVGLPQIEMELTAPALEEGFRMVTNSADGCNTDYVPPTS